MPILELGTYRPMPILELGGPHLFGGPVRAPTSHTLFDGPEEAPPGRLEMQSGVVINGIVYSFSVEVPLDQDDDLPDQDVAPKRIALFDLETEEWRAILQGPQIHHVGEAVDALNSRMAALSGSLVVVHCHHPSMDLEKQLWVKQHSINVNLSVMRAEFNIRPLLVLNDGRILI